MFAAESVVAIEKLDLSLPNPVKLSLSVCGVNQLATIVLRSTYETRMKCSVCDKLACVHVHDVERDTTLSYCLEHVPQVERRPELVAQLAAAKAAFEASAWRSIPKLSALINFIESRNRIPNVEEATQLGFPELSSPSFSAAYQSDLHAFLDELKATVKELSDGSPANDRQP
jgi:hypothetical protein